MIDRRTLLASGAAALATAAEARARPLLLQRPLLDDILTLRSEPRFAGAVSSLRFRGVEFIDAADHGRLLQSAIHFDGLGECLNPTQGGASSDKRRSTSRLLAAETTPDRWAVRTRMAYWLRPGQTCDLPGRPQARAANRERLSPTVVDQTYTFGRLASGNAVRADVTFTTVQTQASVVVEVLTAYVPPSFNRLYLWREGAFAPTEPAAEQPHAYALATADGASAISLYAPASLRLSQMSFGGFSYGVVGKLNAVVRPEGAFAPGPHPYALAWAVGTLEEVASALRADSV